MRLHELGRAGWGILPFLISGCAVTRPLPMGLDATTVSAFLAEHPQANLHVTEHSGRSYWVHAPLIRGDSLIGQRRYDVPVVPRRVPLARVAQLGTSHFSWGRTGAAFAGTLAAAGIALAILIDQTRAVE